MKLLNMKDLEFGIMDYKQRAPGIREWLLASLKYHPRSFLEISRITGIKYLSLFNFANRKAAYMNYKNMCKLREYIKGLMIIEVNELEEESFFKS